MVVLALAVVLGAAGISRAAEEITVSGTVSPDGSFLADDGEEYLIKDDKVGKEFKQKSGEVEYTVTGAVEEVDGRMVITVEKFESSEDD